MVQRRQAPAARRAAGLAGLAAALSALATVTTAAAPAKPAAGTATKIAARPPQPVTFGPGCTPGPRALIAAVGDLLFHDALQQRALGRGGDFRRFFAPVQAVLAGADDTYANMESPLAAGVRQGGLAARDPGRVLDGRVYGRAADALIFNVHPSAAADLKAVGFTVLSTANNHAADRGALGIDRTLDALRAAGIAATGTRRQGEVDAPWHAVTRANGLSIAWLACTFGLNGLPDRLGQVLGCTGHRDTILAEIARLAADPAIDAVILTPHWGIEGSHVPLAADKALARDAVFAGATAVIGTHPHVLQPWEKVVAPDGREGLVVYSTGNFISNQPAESQRSGAIVLVEIVRPALDVATGGAPKARVSAAGFVPTYVDIGAQGHRVVELSPAKGGPVSALRRTLQVFPAGNRVAAADMRRLPRDCRKPVTVTLLEPHAPPPAEPARQPSDAILAVEPQAAPPPPPAVAEPHAGSANAHADPAPAPAPRLPDALLLPARAPLPALLAELLAAPLEAPPRRRAPPREREWAVLRSPDDDLQPAAAAPQHRQRRPPRLLAVA